MAVLIMNGVLEGHISSLSIAFASGNDEEFKQALTKLINFEKENELVKLFKCKVCGVDLFCEGVRCKDCSEVEL